MPNTSNAFFPKVLFSNKELLKTNRWSMGKLVLIFILNISLICAPFFMSRAKTDASDVIDYMPGIETALTELYQLELNAKIENLTFVLSEPYDTVLNLNGYQLYLLPTSLESINAYESRIIFYEHRVSLHYIDSEDERNNYTIDSSYRLLEGLDFSKINRVDLEMEYYDDTTFYRTINETVLTSILKSDLPGDLSMIYLAQFVQTILYALIMSFLLMAANLRRQVKKIYYSSSLKYTIFGITGPAIIAAIVGLFSTLIGTILWSALYAVRIIILYTKINNSDETY